MNLRKTLTITALMLGTTPISGSFAQETTSYGDSVDVQLVLVDVLTSTPREGSILDLKRGDQWATER